MATEDFHTDVDDRALSTTLDETVKTKRDPFIGKIIGERYHVLSLIGAGGWGRVYEVEHTLLNNRLAMKAMHARHAMDDDKTARFKREAQALVALDHPNVARVVDFTIDEEGHFCLMMELLKGASLAQELKARGPLPLEEAIDVVLQICEGLSAAHDKHIAHRDIKPENIWISRDQDGKPRVKVIDFGLASIVDESGTPSTHLTATGETIGTPIYMSPEQCRGKRADARTDIYSAGCVLYETLTGKQAFYADNLLEALMKHIEGRWEPIAKANPALKHPSFQAVMDKALAVEVSDRYQSIRELASDLQSIKDGKLVEQRGGLTAKWRRLQQKKSPTILVFLFGCATVSLVMLPIVLGRRFDYQMLMFRAMFCFMLWALITNVRKMFSSASTAQEKVAARWGTLAYSLMLPNAFCFTSQGLVPDTIRHQLAQVVYNPVYIKVSIGLIALAMFLSFWTLKRSPKKAG